MSVCNHGKSRGSWCEDCNKENNKQERIDRENVRILLSSKEFEKLAKTHDKLADLINKFNDKVQIQFEKFNTTEGDVLKFTGDKARILFARNAKLYK